ncbi:MAG: murein biosynthesis integral membrane protein MurJ, partial [Clostridiales bacterium]|nr:murein biosynthesis integral membrane protein MurJ [Clostridiales bacterium]
MKETQDKRLASAALIVMSSIILSRLTGFIREIALSWKVGLSWAQDAYNAAFTVPDLMYTLLVGGTIGAALIPFLSGSIEKGEEKEGWKAVSTFITVIFAGMLILCTLGIIFAPQIIPMVAWGFKEKSPRTQELAIMLTRILFPSVSFLMLAGICNGVLNTYRKFAAAAYGPSIYNIGCSISIILFADKSVEGMKKVAVGVAVSAAAYFLFQLSFALKDLKLYKPAFNLKDTRFIKLFRQAIPSLLSSSISQVNLMISIGFVTLVAGEGGISAFRNANTIWQLPYGIFAMGIGTAILPTLSRKFATGELDDYKSILMKSLNTTLFLTIPSAVGFIVLREPVVRAIFRWGSGGSFDESYVPIVAAILLMFSTSMITQSVVTSMNRAFYATHDTKTPLFAGVLAIVLNYGFGYLFYKTTELGASGMALSYSIISVVNSVLLIILLNHRIEGGILLDKMYKFLLKALPAALIMGVALRLLEMLPY